MSIPQEISDKFVRFVVVDCMGKYHEVTPESFDQCPAFLGDDPRMALLLRFIRNEIGKVKRDERPPKHIEYMFYESNIQVSTVQWDVKDGERFDIGFVDTDGLKKPCPVIIHASSFGSIERTLCAILESIAVEEAAGRIPMFPLWLAPTQVRLVPVSGEHIDHAVEISERLSSQSIRVDVDDTVDTVGKKVRNAELEWVPYIAVIGNKERQSNRLAVRERRDAGQRMCSEAELLESIRAEVGSMPYRPIPLPRLISERPIFWG